MLVRRQDGFTLIEVMVAMLVATIAMTGLAALLIGAQNQSTATVQEAQLLNVATAQIDQIRAAVQAGGFDALAMSAAPAVWSTATVDGTWEDPDNFSATNASCGYGKQFSVLQNYDLSTSGAPPGFTPWSGCGSSAEPLQILSGGIITVPTGSSPPGCSSDASTTTVYSSCTQSLMGGGTVTVDTFVTDTYVGCSTATYGSTSACPAVTSSTVSGCASASNFPASTSVSTPCADARRVIVAVVPSSAQTAVPGGKPVTPLYIDTVFTNPAPAGSSSTAVGLTLGATL